MTETSPNPTTGPGFIPASSPVDAPPATVSNVPARAEPAVTPGASPVGDQLARIEDKCARIEDKYARSEALLSRVDDKIEGAANRMNEAARQSDLAALRSEVRAIGDRTRRLPGAGALVLTAVITALLTVVLMIAVQRLNLEALLPR